MSIYKSQAYYINSGTQVENRNVGRLSGTSSNFTYAIDIPEGTNFDSVCVLSLSIPYSYYLIRSPYNSFILREDGVDTTVTLPDGNYDARSLALVLISRLNLASPNGWIYNVTVDYILALYNFSVSGNSSQPVFSFSDNQLGDVLGFSESSTNPFIGGLLTSSRVLNFNGTNSLYLHSDMVDDKTSVLQEVYPNSTKPFTPIVWNCPSTDMYTKRLKTNSSGLFNFSLTDEYGVEINLNGHDISFTLLLYKRVSIADLYKNWIGLRVAEEK